MSKTISVNGKNIKYQIWDTAGQEKYHSLARKLTYCTSLSYHLFPSFILIFHIWFIILNSKQLCIIEEQQLL